MRLITKTKYPTYKLGEIARSTKGKKPQTISKEKTDGFEIPYVDIKAFEKGIIDNYTNGENCTFCTPDDVLIVWDGARCGFVGRGIEGAIGSTLAKISSEEYINDYLFYFLQSKYKELNSNPRGVGIPHIEPNLLWNFEIPDIDKTTQHQIVSRIESLFAELDKAVEHLCTAQQQLKTYRQAVLNHWLNNEDGKWETVKLKDCSKKIFAGGDVPKNNYSEIKTEKYRIPIYANALKQKGLYGYTDVSRVNEPCVTIAGRGSGTGHTEIREEPFFPIVRLIVVIPSEYLNNSFLKYMIDSKTMAITGSAIPQLTVPTVEEYEFLLPPLSEQQRIVEEIETHLSQAESAEARIAEALQKTEALRQSILKKAFSGELV